MPEMTPEEKFEFGGIIGETIIALFEIMARVDGMSLQDAVDSWVETYVANRIIGEAMGETDAEE